MVTTNFTGRHILAVGSTIALILSNPVGAQDGPLPPGTFVTPGVTGQPSTDGKLCPNNGFLSGLAVKLTDRVTSLFMRCQTTTVGGLWGTDAPVSIHVEGDVTPSDVELNCPRDYFITGIGYTTGSYHADTHGLAQANNGRLIADLRPVCRLQLGEAYVLNRNFLVGAEDNDLQDIFWTDGNPRDCPKGMAAVGVSVTFDPRRDIDPMDPFFDVALFCRALPILRHGINTLHG